MSDCPHIMTIGEGRKPVTGTASVSAEQSKMGKASFQKKDSTQVSSVPEKKGTDRVLEKDRKKDVPPPRMQFDDKSRVEKAKRRAVVNQSEARNIVELFRHLPQYVHGTQFPDLEAKFFQLDPMHPSVYKVSNLFSASSKLDIEWLQVFFQENMAGRNYFLCPVIIIFVISTASTAFKSLFFCLLLCQYDIQTIWTL